MQKTLLLIGNPNVGKTSIFNLLTKSKQKVANYSGVTLDLAEGFFNHEGETYRVIDLPGTYNLYPSSLDEEVVLNFLRENSLTDNSHISVGIVANATDLKKSLLLLGQVADMGFKVVFILNRMDEVGEKEIEIDLKGLERDLGIRLVAVSAKTNSQLNELKEVFMLSEKAKQSFYKIREESQPLVEGLARKLNLPNEYLAWQSLLSQSKEETNKIYPDLVLPKDWHPKRQKTKETLDRYTFLQDFLDNNVKFKPTKTDLTSRIDSVLIHPFSGYLIFGFILLMLFHAVYSWSAPSMDWIDRLVNVELSAWLRLTLEAGPFTELLINGVLPGVSGVLVFVPQITLLFLFLIFLEESGYMSRVIFLMDKWLKPFGLSGKSIIPLISGVACAVPAIMATKTIESRKERLITILVTPFMVCSARLPVYTILIAIIIPQGEFFFFEYQALVLFAMYLLGVFFVLIGAIFLKFILKSKYESYLITELPSYSLPKLKNFILQIWDKVLSFVYGAGKIIFSLSILIWLLSQIGWNDDFKNAELVSKELKTRNIDSSAEAIRIENSLLGIMGKALEPAIEPLGYDWKIGIGIISSLVAREVFVGTMSTIYSLENSNQDQQNQGIIDKMRNQTHPKTGKKIYSFATGCSLLVFYALAMQCFSTLAVVKNETKSWKWPILQLIGMSGLAYVFSLLIFQLLS